MYLFGVGRLNFLFFLGGVSVNKYVVDILWCQPITLIQVVSTSEFHEWNGTTLFLFFLSPWLVAGPQKSQTFTDSKPMYENFGPKIQIPH